MMAGDAYAAFASRGKDGTFEPQDASMADWARLWALYRVDESEKIKFWVTGQCLRVAARKMLGSLTNLGARLLRNRVTG
jgi:hypothetical protein